jgi:Na+/H+-dicarboxylate symporter
MKFWIKMVSGLILGIVVGGYLGPDSIFLEPFRTAGLLFIRVLGFLVLPLLLFTATRSVVRLRGSRRLFILFVKSMGWFVLLTAVGAAIGMALGEVLKPGLGINIREFESPAAITYPETSGYILGIVPESLLELLRSGYGVLAALFVAFLLGTGILLAERHADPFAGVLESLDHVLHRLNRIVLEFLPIGVFLYIGYFMGFMTASTLLPYLKLILIVAAGSFIQIFIVQALLVYFTTGNNPFTFLLGVLPALIVGYVSGNRYTSYPALVECVEHNLGADREVFTVTAGLGTAFSLSGSAIAAGVSTLFVAQAYGLDLSVYLQIIIVFLITASSLKLDGLTEGGLVLLSVVLAHIIKLPAEGYALIMSVSVILFQIETVVNVAGNAAVSYMLACSEDAVKQVRVQEYI